MVTDKQGLSHQLDDLARGHGSVETRDINMPDLADRLHERGVTVKDLGERIRAAGDFYSEMVVISRYSQAVNRATVAGIRAAENDDQGTDRAINILKSRDSVLDFSGLVFDPSETNLKTQAILVGEVPESGESAVARISGALTIMEDSPIITDIIPPEMLSRVVAPDVVEAKLAELFANRSERLQRDRYLSEKMASRMVFSTPQNIQAVCKELVMWLQQTNYRKLKQVYGDWIGGGLPAPAPISTESEPYSHPGTQLTDADPITSRRPDGTLEVV